MWNKGKSILLETKEKSILGDLVITPIGTIEKLIGKQSQFKT